MRSNFCGGGTGLTPRAVRLQSAKRSSSNAFCGRTIAAKKHRGLRSGTDIACEAPTNKISVLIEKAATDARLHPSRDGPTNHKLTSVKYWDARAV
jgi:hypothetical protein